MADIACIICGTPLVRKSSRGVPPRYCDTHRPTWRADNPALRNVPQTFTQPSDGRWVDGTDDELVQLYQQGDEAAFAAIYQRYAPRLVVYIWRRCSDWHLAEDLVQEAMIMAARYIPHGTMHDLNGYLILCTRQVWWMRKAQFERRPQTETLDTFAPYRGYTAQVEDLVLVRETIAETAALLDTLPDEDRAVARLKLLYGYDLAGVAEVLGRGRSNVGAAWRRCFRKFEAWAGSKSGHAALEQALILASYPESVPLEGQCRVPGCARARYAYERCQYHAESMLARRQHLAAKRGHCAEKANA